MYIIINKTTWKPYVDPTTHRIVSYTNKARAMIVAAGLNFGKPMTDKNRYVLQYSASNPNKGE